MEKSAQSMKPASAISKRRDRHDFNSVANGQSGKPGFSVGQKNVLSRFSRWAALSASGLAIAAVAGPVPSAADVIWDTDRTISQSVSYPVDNLFILNRANVWVDATVAARDLNFLGNSYTVIGRGASVINNTTWSLIKDGAIVTVLPNALLQGSQYINVMGDSYATGGTLRVSGGGTVRRMDGSPHVVQLGDGGLIVLGDGTAAAPILQYASGGTFRNDGWIASDGWESTVAVNMAGQYTLPTIRPYQDYTGNMAKIALEVRSGDVIFDQRDDWAGSLRSISILAGSLEVRDSIPQGLSVGLTTIAAGAELIANGPVGLSLTRVTGAGGVVVKREATIENGNATYKGSTRLSSGASFTVINTNTDTTVTESGSASFIFLSNSTINGVYGAATLVMSGGNPGVRGSSDLSGRLIVGPGNNTFSEGRHRFSGSLAGTGPIRITNGGTFAAAGSVVLSDVSVISVAGLSKLDLSELSAAVNIKRLLNEGSTGGEVRLGAGGLTLTNAQSGDRFSGVISGAAGFSLNGGSGKVQELAGTNTYTGGTAVYDSAMLKLVSTGSIADSSVLNIYGNGVFDISAVSAPTSSIRSLTGATNGSVNLGTKTLRITNGSIAGIYAGAVIGSGGLTIAGGTQKFSGDLTFTGATTVDAGAVLWLGNGGTTGSIVGGATVNGELVLERGNTVELTTSRTISGSGMLSKLGTGDLLVRSAQLYSGATNIRNGKVVILDDGSLAQSSIINIDALGTFDLSRSNNGATIKGLSGDGAVVFGSQNGQRGLTITSGGTFGGTISGYGDLRIAGGNQTLTGDNTFTGTVYLAGTGNLTIGSAGVPNRGALSNANVETGSSGRLIFMRSDADGVFGGRVQGGGGVTQAGSGTTTLTGEANTYTGETIVSAGTLRLSGASSLDRSSGVTVENGATFDISAVNSATSIKKVSGTGAINLAGKTLTLTEQNGAFAGRFTGAGGNLVLAGPQLSISQDSDFTGTLTINSGSRLIATDAAKLSGASNLIVSGTLDVSGLNAATATFGATSIAGSGGSIVLGSKGLDISAGRAADVFAGVIQGSGALRILGGTQSLSGANSYSGDTYIGANASLRIVGGGSVGDSRGVTIAQTGTFDISGTAGGALPGTAIQALSGGGVVQLGTTTGAARTLSITSSGTYGGVVSGFGDLRISGAGTQTLTGNSTFSGWVRVASGSIRIGDGGSSGALLNANVEVQSGQQLIFDRSDELGSFGGRVTGSGELVQIGTGTTTLANVNSHTGATRVQAGRLALRGAGDVSSSNEVIISGGATFDVSATSNGATAKQISSNGPGVGTVSLGSQTLSLTQQNGLFSGVIEGSGGLTLSAFSQLLTLTGTQSYTGTTNISSGILRLSGAGSIESSRGVTVDATLDISDRAANAVIASLSGTNSAGRVILGGNTLEIANSSGAFAGMISGNGGLVLRSGNLTLTNANTYSGSTTIGSGGYLTLGNGGASGEIQGNVSFSGQGELRFDRSNSITFASTISGAGSVVQQGTGNTIFTTAQNYTGVTRITAGSLRLEGGGSVASSSEIVADSNFNVSQVANDVVEIRSLSGANTGTVTLGDRRLIVSNGSGTFAGVVSGAGATLTLNAGSLTLAGNNTFSGQTTIKAGASLAIGAGGTTGSIVSSTVLNDGILAFSRSDRVAFAGSISGGGVLRQTGNGTTVLTGSVAASQTRIEAGMLSVEGANAFDGDVVISAGATLNFAKTQEFSYRNVISGAGRLVQSGAGLNGKLILLGTNTFTGGTTIVSGATLQLGSNSDGGSSSGSLSGDVVNDGTLILNRSNDLVLAGVMSGSGSLIKNGVGRATISGNNTYTGITQVNSGELAVNGSLGNTNVSVATGATISGTGAIGGNVDVAGFLNPGQSPGTMTIGGNLTLSSLSVSNFELGEAGVVGGANNDLVIVNGALTLNGTLNVTASNAGYYRLFNVGSGISGSFQTVNIFGGSAGSYATVYTDTPGASGLATQVNIRLLDANQQIQEWDGARYVGGAQAQGGSGTWNASNTNWLAPGSQISGSWAGSIARFGGAAGTVTVEGTVGFSEIGFDVDGYKLVSAGSGVLQLSSGGSTQTSSIIAVSNSANVVVGAQLIDGDLSSLTKVGTGRLILTADNTYTGNTYVTAGVLQLGDNGSSGSVAGNIANSGEVVFYRSGATTYGGIITGGIEPNEGGVVSLAGVSDVTFTGIHSYTGATNVGDGVLRVAGLGSIANSSIVRINTGRLDISGSFDGGTSVRSIGGSGSIDLGDNTLTVTSASANYAGTIAGAGGLTLRGGTLILNGDNTYTGDTTVLGGTLELSDVPATGGSSQIGRVAGRIVTGVGTNAGSLTLNYSDLVEPTFTNNIVGTGALVKQGAGVVHLVGDVNHTGGTAIRGGALAIGNDGNAGSLSGNVNTGDGTGSGRLEFWRNDEYVFTGDIFGTGQLAQIGPGRTSLTGSAFHSGGTQVLNGMLAIGNGGSSGSLSGDVELGAGASLVFNRDAVTVLDFTGSVSGDGNLRQEGTGRTRLSSAQFYTGTTDIANGVLSLEGAANISDSSVVTIAGPGILDISGASDPVIINRVRGEGNIVLGNQNLVISMARYDNYAGVLSGTGGVTIASGSQNFYGANTYTGNTFVSSGAALSFGGSSGSVAGNIVNDGSLTFMHDAGVHAYAGSISGSGTLLKSANGLLVLSGASSYTGSTTVAGGTLRIEGSLSGSPVTVESGATLSGGARFDADGLEIAGSGIINGDVTIEAGGSLTAGSNLRLSSLTLRAGSITNFDVSVPDVTSDARNSRVIVTNGLQLDGTLNVAVAKSGYYRLFSAGGITGDFSDINVTSTSPTQIIRDYNVYKEGENAVTELNMIVLADDEVRQFWNGSQTTAGALVGGSGTWNSSNTNWLSPNFASVAPWVGSYAIFDGSAGIVTVEGNQNFDRLQFKADSYALVAGQNAALKINNLGMIIVDGQRTAMVGVALVNGNTGDITKTGSGVLDLTALNEYTGNTKIEAGTLALSGVGSIAQSAEVQIGVDGVLDIARTVEPSTSIKGLGGSGSVVLGDKSLDLTGGSHSFSGVISGDGGITVLGGDHALNGANTFTGIARLSHGVLSANHQNALSSARYVSLDNADAIFDISAASAESVKIKSLAGVGEVRLGAQNLSIVEGSASGSASGTFGGVISGSGSVSVLSGTVRLTGLNTYTGATRVSSGANLDIGGLTTSGSLSGNIYNDGRLDFSYSGGSHVYGGTISGVGTVNISGSSAAEVVLTGANSLSGEVEIQQGTLRLAGDGALNSGLVRIGDSGAFNISSIDANNTSIRGLVGSGSVLLGSKGLTLNGGVSAYYGVISGEDQSSFSIAAGSLTSLGTITATNVIVANGSRLAIGNGQNMGTLASNVTVDGELEFNRADAVTFANTIAGSGLLLKRGEGTLNLNATNSFSGKSIVSGGTLRLVENGTLNGDIVNDANVTFARSNAWTYGGTMTGSGALKIGSAQTTVTGDLVHTGGTTIDSASLVIGNGGTTGSVSGDIENNSVLQFNRSDVITFGGKITGVGTVVQAGFGQTILTGNNSYSGGTTIFSGTLQLGDGIRDGNIQGDVTNYSTLAFQQTTSSEFSGTISGWGDLIQKGAGALILTADNTYIGRTIIDTGSTLQVGNGGASGRISNAVKNDGTLSFLKSTDTVFNGVISGAGNLRQEGSGALLLGSEQQYTGLTSVSAGSTLVLTANGSIARSDVLNLNGRFDISGISSDVTAVGDISGEGDIQLGSKTLSLTKAGSEFSGKIGGVGGLNINAGTWKVTSNQNYTGATQVAADAGFVLEGEGAVSNSSNVIVDGTFSIVGTRAGASVKSLSGSDSGRIALGDQTISITSGTGTYNGAIEGTGGVTISGGTLVLTGANRYSGLTSIASGANLEVRANPASSGPGDFLVDGNLKVDVGAGYVFSFDKKLTGSGSFIKSGEGQLVISDLSDAEAYVGSTIITGGNLAVNGHLGGDVAARASSVLSGKGTIGGNVNIGAGAILSAGTSPGTLTINGNLSLADGSVSKFELAEANTVGGTSNDHVVVRGALDVGGALEATVSSIGYYRLFSAGSISGDFAAINVSGLSGQIDTAVYVNNPGPASVMNLSVIGRGDHLQFWDGADTVGDNNVSGGTGTWTAASTNWTDAFGNINANWRSSLAVFGGNAGVVTVEGNQSFSAMQFDVDGYVLQSSSSGGTLLLQPSSTNSNATINVASGNTATITTAIADGASTSLSKGMGGKLVLSAENTYTGETQISSGTLALAGFGSISSSSGVNIGQAGVFDVSSALTQQVDVARLGGTGSVVLGNNTLRVWSQDSANSNFNGTFGGVISGQGGGLTLVAGGLTLTGENTYAGLTKILSGSQLSIGDGSAKGAIAGDIRVDGTAAFNHGDVAKVYAGKISGSGTLIKRGSSTLSLSGNSSDFGGETIVDAGKLAINGALGGSVTVKSGGTVGGSGAIYGNATVATGGTLSAGNSPGTLTVNGDLTLSSGSTSAFELGQRGIVGGTQNDLVIVNGALVYGGTLNVSASSSGFYRLFEANSVDGGFDAVNVTVAGVSGTGGIYLNGPGAAKTVNLAVLKDGQSMMFWDGADTMGNGNVDGGSGTWSADHTNWTSGPGEAEVNGPWGGSVGVFSGTGGKIDIVGSQQFDTLQFNVDGYNLTGSSGSLNFSDATGGTINVAPGATASIATPITGGSSKGFVKTGGGALILTADNQYFGGTVIDAGTLQLGAGGTSGSISGKIVNNGLLVTDRNDLLTLSDEISGSGAVSVVGGGTTLLTANNTYTGGTSILNGAVQLGAGGETGSLTGDVKIGNAGALVINRSNDFTLIANLSGDGSLRQVGPNITTLQGDSCAFTGTTTVTNGKLIVRGCLGGKVVVENGGSVGGEGTIGGGSGGGTVTIGNGGTFSPGGDDTIGRTTVASNLSITPGAIYVVNVDASGASDHTQVTGVATITGGTVQVLAAAGNYRPITKYTILSAEGGLNLGGTGFNNVTSSLAFLTPSLSYDANHVYLTMTRNNVGFDTVSETPNQSSVGRAVEKLQPGNPVYDAVIGLDKENARKAFADLSGEIHATLLGSGVQTSLALQDAITNRLRGTSGHIDGKKGQSVREIRDGELGVQSSSIWGTVYGSSRSTSSDGNASGSTSRSGGLISGFEGVVDGGSFDNWRLGAVGQFGTNSLDVRDVSSSAQSEVYSLGIYGGGTVGPLNVNLGATQTLLNVSTEREVRVGAFTDKLDGDYSIGITNLFGEVSYEMNLNDTKIEPFGGLGLVVARSGSFTEEGGAAALSSSGNTYSSVFTTVGVRAERSFELENGVVLTSKGSVGWRHAFNDIPDAVLGFGDRANFEVRGLSIDRDALMLDLGVETKLSENVSLGLTYSGQFSSGSSQNSGKLTLDWKF